MAMRDIFHRTAVYFGLAEDRYEDDEERYEAPPSRSPEAEIEDRYRDRPNVRRMPSRRRRDEFDDIFADDDASPRASRGSGGGGGSLRAVSGGGGRNDSRVHLVTPNSFNDAQEIGNKFKDGVPVIINLQGVENTLSVRLIDFVSGLAYALDGGMSKIAEKTFLLTPHNVEVSAEERQRLVEKGFFNQS
jgi:cell division inhibitor SepF